MENEKIFMDSCTCKKGRPRSMNVSHSCVVISLVVLLAAVNLPRGSCAPHIASVLESSDGVPGISSKSLPRGPTVAPLPSAETLKQLELHSRNGPDGESYFSPADAIRSLLSLSSSSQRLRGFKRVSQFHGNGDLRANYRAGIPKMWDFDEEDANQMDDEDGQPTFVPYIGPRALTNIPQFFEHLKENIEALKLSPPLDDDDDDENSESGNDEDSDGENDLDSNFEERLPKKDMSKPAARRMKTEFHVDESVDDTRNSGSDSWSAKQNWKPRAAGIIHYYAPKTEFLETQHQQNILRRANNYNPGWLYTNLGLGKRRRR